MMEHDFLMEKRLRQMDPALHRCFTDAVFALQHALSHYRRLKTYEKRIASRDFDFIGMMSELEEFGRRNMVSRKMIYRAQPLFEELCVQILLPQLLDKFVLLAAATYSQRDESMTMQIRYSGPAFDPADTENMLSMALVRNAAEEMKHSLINEDELTNPVLPAVAGCTGGHRPSGDHDFPVVYPDGPV